MTNSINCLINQLNQLSDYSTQFIGLINKSIIEFDQLINQSRYYRFITLTPIKRFVNRPINY